MTSEQANHIEFLISALDFSICMLKKLEDVQTKRSTDEILQNICHFLFKFKKCDFRYLTLTDNVIKEKVLHFLISIHARLEYIRKARFEEQRISFGIPVFCLSGFKVDKLDQIKILITNFSSALNFHINSKLKYIAKSNLRQRIRYVFQTLDILLARCCVYTKVPETRHDLLELKGTKAVYYCEQFYNLSTKGKAPTCDWKKSCLSKKLHPGYTVLSLLNACDGKYCPVCHQVPFDLNSNFAIVDCCDHLICILCSEMLLLDTSHYDIKK